MENSNLSIDHDAFEDIMIYNVFNDSRYISTVIDYLLPEYFKKTYVKELLPLIVSFYKKRGVVPNLHELKTYLVTAEQKNSFKEYVLLQKNLRANYNSDELYELTERFIKEKAVYNTLLAVVDKCTNNEINTADILKKFESACNISLVHNIGLDYFKDIETHIKDLETKENYISTGWSWLDKKLNGGFMEGGRALYVVAGGTNVGKSIVLANLAVNMANQGKTVLLVSLEMSELMYAKRISSKVTQLPINNLPNQIGDLRERISAYRLSHPGSRLIIKEFPPATVTPQQLTGFIDKLCTSNIKVDAIVIDYLTLLNSPVGTSLYEKGKHITEQVRAMTYKFKCPIISAAQINREGMTMANPGIETIGESLGIGQTLDCLFGVWQEDEDKELGIIRMGMMKNRFGANFGSCSLKIDYSTLTLSENEVLSDTEESTSVESTIKLLANNA